MQIKTLIMTCSLSACFLFCCPLSSCRARTKAGAEAEKDTLHEAVAGKMQQPLVLGDERTDQYLPLLKDKRVALFSNHSGMVNGKHILDLLLEQGINVTAIFSPEHGFRGRADAGEHVKSSVDAETGVPILSLYDGKIGRPDDENMRRFDALVVDIQDVGLRFYTYYASMCRLMDACAQFDREVVVLDRPNPNGHYVDGPLLDMKYKSAVGWLPLPVVHGLTLGEMAGMINGEGWLSDRRKCRLTVVPCLGYTHRTPYRLPVAPSPNLPNMRSIYLYPSMCYFEATPVSLGRGTDKPFQIYGHPLMKDDSHSFSFTPESRPGAKQPPLLGKTCYGIDLSHLSEDSLHNLRQIDLSYLTDAYRTLKKAAPQQRFFTPFFEKLIGNGEIRGMIEAGRSAEEIRATWQDDVERFKKQRKKYLLYEE